MLTLFLTLNIASVLGKTVDCKNDSIKKTNVVQFEVEQKKKEQVDSVFNLNIINSQAYKELQNKILLLDSIITNLKQKQEELSSNDVSLYAYLLTFFNFIAFIYLFLKLKNIKKETDFLQKEFKNDSSRTLASNLNFDLNDVSHCMGQSESSQQKQYNSHHLSENRVQARDRQQKPVKVYGKEPVIKSSFKKETESSSVIKRKKLHRFTNLMEDNNQLSTYDRSISDNGSDKLFVMEYDEGTSVATYTINAANKNEVLSDIQTFQKYAEEFTISGKPTDVAVVKSGKMEKQGKRWVVTEKIIVEFK